MPQAGILQKFFMLCGQMDSLTTAMSDLSMAHKRFRLARRAGEHGT